MLVIETKMQLNTFFYIKLTFITSFKIIRILLLITILSFNVSFDNLVLNQDATSQFDDIIWRNHMLMMIIIHLYLELNLFGQFTA